MKTPYHFGVELCTERKGRGNFFGCHGRRGGGLEEELGAAVDVDACDGLTVVGALPQPSATSRLWNDDGIKDLLVGILVSGFSITVEELRERLAEELGRRDRMFHVVFFAVEGGEEDEGGVVVVHGFSITFPL